MQAIQRFNLVVSTTTVVVMFLIIQYLLPMLQAAGVPAEILQRLPFITPEQIVASSKIVLTGLVTLGTYTLLARLLMSCVDWIPLLKSFIFGQSYMEGTWIGRFGTKNGPKWTVEHFEQTLGGIVIRGWAENEDGSRYAEWTSDAVSIDGVRGRLTYTYDCDVFDQHTKQQGIGVFQFERSATRKAPTGITGYSADLIDGERSENHEVKIASSSINVDQSMIEARKRFPPVVKRPAVLVGDADAPDIHRTGEMTLPSL